MRRRLAGMLLPALLALSLLAAPALAEAPAPGPIVLAAEEPTGPLPMERTAEENPARELAGYEDRELQFTWGAAWILTVLGLGGVALLGGLYWLLVHRPSQETAGRR